MQNVVSQNSSVPHCYFSHWLLPSVFQTMTDVVQMAPFSGMIIPIQGTPGSWTPEMLVIPHLQGSAFSSTVSVLDVCCFPTPMGYPGILLSPRIASAQFALWKCCLHVLDFSLQNSCIMQSSLWLKLPRKVECFGVGFWNTAIKVQGLVPLPVNSIARNYIKAAPSLCMAWFRDSIKGKHYTDGEKGEKVICVSS